MRAVMITPTRAKDYRNPHIQTIWYQAERALRRGLGNLDPGCITVVEYDEAHRDIRDHPVGRRFQSMFGSSIEWHTGGFQGWLSEVQQAASIA